MTPAKATLAARIDGIEASLIRIAAAKNFEQLSDVVRVIHDKMHADDAPTAQYEAVRHAIKQRLQSLGLATFS